MSFTIPGRPAPLVTLLLLSCMVLQGALGQVVQAEAPPVRYDEDYPDPAFHASRRALLMDGLPDTSLAIVLSAPERVRENDVVFEYRQSSDLFYLTGTHEPTSALLLAPHGMEVDGRLIRELLFVPPRTDHSELWLGRRFGAEGAEAILGIPAVSSDRFDELVEAALSSEAPPIYWIRSNVGTNGNTELARQIALVSQHVAADPRGREQSTELRRLINDLRAFKTAEELVLMQKAIDLTADALRTAMGSIEPGMYEYEVEALIQYVFHRGGSEYPAFPSIVASGENAVILHYESNRRKMEAGDLVLMDVGAEYRFYAADVTRTVPVSGTFTHDQRALYQLVLDALEAGIDATRSGNAFQAPDHAARAVLEDGLRRLGILTPGGEVTDFFPHSASHYLGLSVHDVRPSDGALAEGQVITVEPGIYIRPSDDIDPRWWNIGIRIEDDVLVTDGDPIVLSRDAPRSVEEIEGAMQVQASGVSF